MFTARAFDIETGLYYYRARYYNPYIGRFLQIDPAYQGMNW
jgi:RHS repeat-associated protein